MTVSGLRQILPAREKVSRASAAPEASLRGRTAAPWRATVSLGLLVALWALAAWAVNDPLRAPSPQAVFAELWHAWSVGKLRADLAATFWRVTLSFVIAMGLGGAIGIGLGLNARLDRWLDSWLTVALNVPALVVVVLCYLWIGLNETAAILAVALNKIPTVAVMLREGVRVLDPGLHDMARLYRMGPVKRLRHVILPQLAPQILAAARTGLSLIWKIVLVVEFLGRSNGIGFRIHLDFQMFDIPGVLANALAFVAVMLAVEWLLLAPLARRALRWRTE